jgi:hypothetical protein
VQPQIQRPGEGGGRRGAGEADRGLLVRGGKGDMPTEEEGRAAVEREGVDRERK